MALFLKNNRRIILVLLVIVVAMGVGYYLSTFKKSKYKPSSFISLDVKWGTGDTLRNSYSSATGIYTYLDRKDRLVHKKVPLYANEIIFLDSKFNELSIWNLPTVIVNKGSNLKQPDVLRCEIDIKYEKEEKHLLFESNYDENMEIADRISRLHKYIMNTISEAEERYTP